MKIIVTFEGFQCIVFVKVINDEVAECKERSHEQVKAG